MDALRRFSALAAVILMVGCALVPIIPMEGSSGEGRADGLLLYEIDQSSDNDAVSVKNYGDKPIDLKNYRISDNPGDKEGSLTVIISYILKPNEKVILATGPSDNQNVTGNILTVADEQLSRSGSYDLSISGDDVYLFDPSGKCLDAVYYGNVKNIDKEKWLGDTVKVKKNYFIYRQSDYDTDSADDWFIHIPGQSNFEFTPDKPIIADRVTPFLFPESGGIPIYQALESAKESVFIEIYEIRSPNIYALLCDLEERDVEVTLLMEGAPTGRPVTEDSRYIKTLIDAGGEVRIIGGTEVDRYDNMHAKYAVIDSQKVVITSENWSASNCNGKIDDNPYDSGTKGNRGWGAVIEDTEYAMYMMDVFKNDYSMEYGDVRVYAEEFPHIVGTDLTYTEPDDHTFNSYTNVDIVPVLSNDNSYEALEYYITGAQKRVYAQNQSLTSYYADLGEKSPVKMMADRASALADTDFEAKFILSSGFGGQDDGAKRQVDLINASTLVSAALMDKPYVHNKGLICDDVAWVSSINWTPTSVENNREACVAIDNAQIAQFFADSFEKDFDRYYSYDGFRVDTAQLKSSYPAGEPVRLSVSVIPEGDYTYVWDLGDGSEPRTTTIPYISTELSDGAHVLKITITDSNGVSTVIEHDYYAGDAAVGDKPGSFLDSLGPLGEYLLPIAVVLIALIIAVTRASGKKKRSRK